LQNKKNFSPENSRIKMRSKLTPKANCNGRNQL
jgi:hypothetical protein